MSHVDLAHMNNPCRPGLIDSQPYMATTSGTPNDRECSIIGHYFPCTVP